MFLSNGSDYSKVPIIRGTAIILDNAVTSNQKKNSFNSMETIRVENYTIRLTKKKKRNFNCRYETNHKFEKRREKDIKENKESLPTC